MSLRQILKSVAAQPHPLRYLAGLLAWRTGLGRWHTFPFRSFRLGLYPTNLSWQMWLNPRQFESDLAWVSKLVPPGGTMIDVGANVGHFALEASTAAGPKGQVLAFEPHPRTFGFLTRNLALNPASNVEAAQVAISNRSGDTFMEDHRRDDMNALCADANDRGGIVVQTRTLDDLLPEDAFPRIDLLKIDVEGAEMQVLRGAARILKRSRALMIEAGDSNSLKFGASSSDLLEFLQAEGLDVRTTSDAKLTPRPEDYVDRVGNWIAVRAPL